MLGAGVKNREPGADSVALAAIMPDGIVDRWHCSQFVPLGIWAFALPAGAVDGITTIFEMPTNEVDEIVGPWQPAQVAIPA